MMKFTKRWKWGLLGAILLSGLAVAGFTRYSDVYFQIKKNFTVFSDVYREVSLRYVDEVDPEKLMRTGIDAMLETLDPYTVLIDESETEQLDIMTTGKYGGVGIEAGSRGDKIVVIAPVEGYSAHRKGVRSGDIIKEVNSISVDELTPEEVQNLIHGEPGTTVNITIERYGVDQELHFELEREYIEVKNIAYAGLIGKSDDVGYILLNRFSQNTGNEVRTAILEFQKKTELSGMVLDLRNNPGGLLNEAVKTVDKFIQPGVKVVETKGRRPEDNNVFRTEEPALLPDTPLIVLQNSGSASASEVVAGALQDLDRAVILGEQSFGKGLVQIVRPLSYNTALKITTSRYYIPSGRSIQSVTYTHDERNGKVDKPDSLKKAYKTRNGRTVYDGEGITPDIEAGDETQSLLEIALLQNSHYFFYANQYASNHDTLAISRVTDEIYNDFRTYLNDKQFDYETRAEQQLEKIQDRFEDKELYDRGKSHIAGLQDLINQEKQDEFEQQAPSIKERLYLELVSRYQGRTGQIKASTRLDPIINRAVELLHNPERYHNVLTPGT